MRIRPIVLAAVLVGFSLVVLLPASAQSLRERLFVELRNAPTEAAARVAENAIWEFWIAAAPTEATRNDLTAAMSKRESYDLHGALRLLNGVVAAAPDYAEGWNQRAFIHFLQENMDESLVDLDRALELEPLHFGALAGKAMVLMRQGRVELGQEVLRRAIEIDPWLRERSMLLPVPGEPPPPARGQPI